MKFIDLGHSRTTFSLFRETVVMSKDLSKQKRGAPLNPMQQDNQSNDPGHQQQAAENGRSNEQYKNVETSVNNRSYFGDDYSVEREDEISRDESRSEDENNS